MTETLSHTFIEALSAPRDRLYALALATGGSPAAAEASLQQSVRSVFVQSVGNGLADIPAAVEKLVGALATSAAPGVVVPPADVAMPADVWARLTAAVQIEAARSNHSQALNPDSVLLQPDPLLAPKKTKPHDLQDDFDLSSPSRMLYVLAAVVLVGVVVTIFILTRPVPPRPATHPSAPASVPPSSATLP